MPGTPTARDEQVVASTGRRDSGVAVGVDAEATSLYKGRREDERDVEVKGVHLLMQFWTVDQVNSAGCDYRSSNAGVIETRGYIFF